MCMSRAKLTESNNSLFTFFVSLLGNVELMKTHSHTDWTERGCLHGNHYNLSPSALSVPYTITVSGRRQHFKWHFYLIFIRNEGQMALCSTRLNPTQVFLTSFIVTHTHTHTRATAAMFSPNLRRLSTDLLYLEPTEGRSCSLRNRRTH